MYVLIITGMSGAGKSHALRKMEDRGFFCVDNLPAQMVMGLVELLKKTPEVKCAAFGVDSRSLSTLPEILDVIKSMRDKGDTVEMLFLDAQDSVLLKRYSETRRNHPLAREGLVQDGISEERARLEALRNNATYYIDTSMMKPTQLAGELENIVNVYRERFTVMVRSFGYKQGIPSEADIVIDVRFVPNPFWVDGLRELSGLDEKVRDYILSFDISRKFLQNFTLMLTELIPFYAKEGKYRLNVCFGCTGGRHRSVMIANEVMRMLNDQGIYTVALHRDIDRDLQK